MAGSAAAARSTAKVRLPEAEELPDYCARPVCRRPFTRTTGPGRRQAYCSELCRRAAEKELRQTRARLAHFESLVDQLQVDVAAFGSSSRDSTEEDLTVDSRRAAEDAVTRVAGMLAFLGDSEDPCARELRQLHDAVAPVVLAGRRR